MLPLDPIRPIFTLLFSILLNTIPLMQGHIPLHPRHADNELSVY